MSEETKNEKSSGVFAGTAEKQVADEQKVADMAVRLSLQAQMAVLKR